MQLVLVEQAAECRSARFQTQVATSKRRSRPTRVLLRAPNEKRPPDCCLAGVLLSGATRS